MPVITIEHSANIKGLDFTQALLPIHEKIVDIAEAKLNACKGRVVIADPFLVGDGKGEENAYILIQIRLLPGRSPDQKEQLAKSVFDIFETLYKNDLSERDIRVKPRVEIVDLDFYYFSSWMS